MRPGRGGLGPVARALGGEAWDGGRRALVPGPGHGPGDRSVSLLLEGDRVIAHSFAGDDWRQILMLLREQGWIDGAGRLSGGGGGAREAPQPSGRERIARAAELWDTAGLRVRGPGLLYLRSRAIGRNPGLAVRSHASVPAAIYLARGRRRPALLSAIRSAGGALSGVEVTLLDPQGRPAAVRTPRRIVGRVPPGSAVRLDPPSETLLVGEGVCTCLSASERFTLPAWALLSVGNLRRWVPPPGVREVVIAADRGGPGQAAAAELSARLGTSGLRVRVLTPPAPFSDWNEVAQAEAET